MKRATPIRNELLRGSCGVVTWRTVLSRTRALGALESEFSTPVRLCVVNDVAADIAFHRLPGRKGKKPCEPWSCEFCEEQEEGAFWTLTKDRNLWYPLGRI
jgi:hypothetical protein